MKCSFQRAVVAAAILVAGLAFGPSLARAQSPSYYYGPPPAAYPSFAARPAVVYGSGMAAPVTFGTPGSVFYSPGYATTYYRYRDATYTPPGVFEPSAYTSPLFGTKPTISYTPGYYSYTPIYTPAYATPAIDVRPSYTSPSRYYRD
jgi:hypothetical protein